MARKKNENGFEETVGQQADALTDTAPQEHVPSHASIDATSVSTPATDHVVNGTPPAEPKAKRINKPRDYSVSFYSIIGYRSDGTREEADRRPTIGQSQRFMLASAAVFKRLYTHVEIVKCLSKGVFDVR